jgi:hypothetical protein
LPLREHIWGPSARRSAGRIIALCAAITSALWWGARSDPRTPIAPPDVAVRSVRDRLVPRAVAGVSRARIAALSARRDTVAGSESVLASYLAVGDDGDVVLVDEAGHTVAREPFVRRGTTRLNVPAGFAAKRLDLLLRVRSGASSAMASVSLPVAGLAVAAPPPLRPRAAVERITAGDDPFAVVGRPVSGRPFVIAVKRLGRAMHLQLEDGAGLAIDEATVGTHTYRVTLRTPRSDSARTFYLTASYDVGGQSELVLRPVNVAAR